MCNLYKIIYDRNFTEHKCIFVYLNNSHPFPPWFGTAHGCCCCRGWRGSEVGGHSSHVLHSDAASVLWTSEHLKTKVNKECISQNIKLCHCRFQYWSGSKAKWPQRRYLGFFLAQVLQVDHIFHDLSDPGFVGGHTERPAMSGPQTI